MLGQADCSLDKNEQISATKTSKYFFTKWFTSLVDFDFCKRLMQADCINQTFSVFVFHYVMYSWKLVSKPQLPQLQSSAAAILGMNVSFCRHRVSKLIWDVLQVRNQLVNVSFYPRKLDLLTEKCFSKLHYSRVQIVFKEQPSKCVHSEFLKTNLMWKNRNQGQENVFISFPVL